MRHRVIGRDATALKYIPEITICAVDCAHPQLAARALALSTAECRFGDAILFSTHPVPGPFRSVPVEPISSRGEYSQFILTRLAAYVNTPFVLIVQWDGYVITPNRWRSEFLAYDYIGAVWPWHPEGSNVGNGGFSLRSTKLLTLAANDPLSAPDGANEDEVICRIYREWLEREHGIQFAPPQVANQFAYERCVQEEPTFGFHGLFNMWRHVDDATMVDIINSLRPFTLCTREAIELMAQYVALRKAAPAIALWSRMQLSMTSDEIRRLVRESLGDSTATEECVETCERWIARATIA